MSKEKINKKGMFFVLVCAAAIASLMSTVMSTALPAIMESFSISASQAQLVTSIYSLVSGIVIITTAIIMKQFPTKRLFMASMGIFTVGILLCAIAPNFPVLLLGRIVQGAGYGVLVSLAQVVILTIVPEEKRGFAMGIYGLAVVFAPVLGPIAAGLIIDHTSWKLIFWIVLALCILDLVLGAIYMGDVLPTSKQSMDVLSLALASIGFSGLVLAAGNMGDYPFVSVQVGLLLLIGIIAMAVFALRQIKLSIPLLDIRVLKYKDFTIAVIVSMILYALMNGMSSVMPILVQSVMGRSATSFGLVIAPCALCLAALSPVTGKLYDKVGLKALAVIGSALVVISNALLLFVGADVPLGVLMVITALLGIGLSGMQMNIVTYGMQDLIGDVKTDGTALLSSLRTMGAALGTAAFVAIMAQGADGTSYSMGDIQRSYLVMTIFAVCVLLISVFLIKNRKTAK